MSRRPYDNAHTVDDEAAVLDDFVRRSGQVYRAFEHRRDIVYANRPRSTLDVFEQPGAIGTVVFIHGGYWQSCAKSDFAFLVPAILEHGYCCILLEYGLAPANRIADIVGQVGVALDFLQQQDWLAGPVALMGHSAGAHLAACHVSHAMVDTAHLVSGIYELAPIRETHLNAALRLGDEEIRRYSPANTPIRPGVPCRIAYGSEELPELQWQSRNLFEQWRPESNGGRLACQPLPGCNHYNILDAYSARPLAIEGH